MKTLVKGIAASICAAWTITALAVEPIFDDAYTADPAPLVVGDTVYCFCGHDADDAEGFKMPDWRLYSTKDMKNWKAHGPVATPETFTWARPNTCWAAQCVERDGKFYFYVTTDKKDGHMSIGVLVADRPEGPYKDPIGGPLVHHCPGDIDPTVLIDDDGQAYLYWGNPLLHTAKLNRDMISIDKSFGSNGIHVVERRITDYQEGPWVWKRNGIYYMAFASTCCPEGIGYATSDSPLGPWKYRGHIMDHDRRSSGNHPGIIEFKGKWYCFGFNYERYRRNGGKKHCERRSVCAAEMHYNKDGSIVQMPWWAECPEIGAKAKNFETESAENGPRLLAYRTPGEKGGLSFLADNGDGKWEHGYHRDFRFTYSNLGNWGEKAILDPFVVRTRAGENHLFFSYVDHRRPSFGHAMSWNKGNVRNWGRENWIDLPDLDKSVHVSDPLVVERKDGNFTVVFRDAAGDGAYKVVTDGKKALGSCEKIDRAKYDAAHAKLVQVVEFDGRSYTGNVVRVTKEMRDLLKSDFGEWHKTGLWHMTIDNAKDDEKRYGEISKGASLKLSVKTPVKPYAISDMLIGLFFEDINSSYELYSTNHVGTYKGHGWRKEAGEALAALKPKFMRFPGGCIVHGHDFKSMYHWKETVGPVSERKGKPNPCWGTYMDFALGYFEYFQLCEDIGAEPLPILPAGVSCPNPQVWVSDEELAQLVQDAVDLVDFAKGDPQKSKWAKIRADMGHPAPFKLNYIGVGNEEDVNDYFERGFKPIFEAIRKKDPSIKVVGTAGPMLAGRDYEEGWKLGRKYNVPILDEHYYVGCGWFYGNQHFYDGYDRKGPKVYAGEYAAHKEGRGNDMETALACAIHLANLERNGDVVAMASYAPLFAKKGATRWAPDLIYFDDEKVYLSTDYWTQWIFGNYGGTEYVPNDLEITVGESKLNKDDQLRYRNRFAASVVKNGKKTIVKVINTTCFPIPFEADLSPLGVKDGTDAEIVEFAGKSFDDKDAKPVTKHEKIAAHFTRTLPANSMTVIAF